MSLLFSRECEYALQAVLYLALKRDGEMTSSREITKRLRIPYHFIGKILQRLARKGLLKSSKGPSGGFSLAVPARSITLLQVIEAVDGAGFARTCLLGFSRCSGDHPCAVHAQWATLRDRIHGLLDGKTLATLATEMHKPAYMNAGR